MSLSHEFSSMAHCRHYGACGGCAFTRGAEPDKRAALEAALARAGYEGAAVGEVLAAPLASRRRADLAVRRAGSGVLLGLHRAKSGEIVDLAECALLEPALAALLPALRPLLRGLMALRHEGSAVLTQTDAGIDVLLRLDRAADAADRAKLVAFARAQDLPRIALAEGAGEPEPVLVQRPAVLHFAGIPVEPAPGGFLQASAAGEAAIVEAVLAGLPARLTAKARIVELYAGCGTLTLPLAVRARVEAFEGDGRAVSALDRALRASGRAGRITVTRRDLVRRPLLPKELAGAAAVVLDPPYAGAAAQMAAIARARAGRVIYVSCNPAALARDARTLKAGGYRLIAATPIDQFRFSDNLESVAVFAI